MDPAETQCQYQVPFNFLSLAMYLEFSASELIGQEMARALGFLEKSQLCTRLPM